jgi:DNA-binding transcriptional LysR family regulator
LRNEFTRFPCFQLAGVRQEITACGNFRSGNGLSLAEMCFSGIGIMRMAEHLALPALRDGRLVRLLTEYEVRDNTAIHAVYLAERQLSPRVRCFLDHLTEAFQVPPWGMHS